FVKKIDGTSQWYKIALTPVVAILVLLILMWLFGVKTAAEFTNGPNSNSGGTPSSSSPSPAPSPTLRSPVPAAGPATPTPELSPPGPPPRSPFPSPSPPVSPSPERTAVPTPRPMDTSPAQEFFSRILFLFLGLLVSGLAFALLSRPNSGESPR